MGYILITVCEREIATELFDLYEQAFAKMLEELGQEYSKEEDFKETWEEFLVANPQEYECDCFGYSKYTAWSNVDDDKLCDWKIVPIPVY